jgi:uncharacterized membrane protein
MTAEVDSRQTESGVALANEAALTRAEMHEPITIAERIADNAAAIVGSWRFIIIQSILVAIWIAFNIWALGLGHFDPFPFVLLNLMFSVQAAYTGPILLLASNRQAARDRAMAQRDDIELGIILQLQHEQLQILSMLKNGQDKQAEILEMLRELAPEIRTPRSR